MRIGNFYIEFYNARKHYPVLYGVDHLAFSERLCRPFARADIQSVLMMISNRLQNVVWQSDPDILALREVYKFLHDNALRILLMMFYNGFVRIDMRDPFRPCFAGEHKKEEWREDEELHVVTVYDEIYRIDGQTRADVLRPHIDMLNTVNDSDLNLILNYGAMGIISPENSAHADGHFNAEEKEEIQKEYTDKYGVHFGKWAMLITRNPVKFQPITLPIRELELNEKRKSALAELLQYMNIPKELHAQFESAKYANRNEAELDMYGNCVTSWAWVFTGIARECYRKIREEGRSKGIDYPAAVDIWFDIVGVPALQEAQWQEKVKAREELAMWRELRAEMPERVDYIDQRINDIIENM